MSNQTLGSSIRFNSLLLGLFAVITTAVLALTYSGTRDRIAEQQIRAQLAALSEIVNEDHYDNDLIAEAIDIPPSHWSQLNLDEKQSAYVATKEKNKIAIIFPTKAKGYSGNIEMLIGIFADGKIAGVRVTQHTETPGLGDYIDIRKSDWITLFEGKSLGNPVREQWETKNHGGAFDGLTSATITSRAVIHQVKTALEYFEEQKPLVTLSTRQNLNDVSQANADQ